MSKLFNEQLAAWKLVCCHNRRTASRVYCRSLSAADVVCYSDVITLWGCTSYELLDEAGGSLPDWIEMAYHAINVPPGQLGQLCKGSLDYLRNAIPHVGNASLCDFKHRTGWGSSPVLKPVLPLLEKFFQLFDASSFTKLNQFFSFPTRCNLGSLDYSSASLEEYHRNEDWLSHRVLDQSLLHELNTIMREWLVGLDASDWHPKHGRGETSLLPKASKGEKYRALATDALLRYWLRDEHDSLFPHPPKKLVRLAEVDFVPKSLTSWRTISKEPASLMYFQQAVWDKLDVFLARHPYLSRRVKLHDDSFNRGLAQIGSAESGRLATIDLSSASDLVGWDLVKAIFRRTPIERALYATRSTHALMPSGHLLELKKFAPMGSALCFPIECLIFLAVCESVARLHPSRRVTFAVYGDDMIIDQDLAPDLIHRLTSLGFRVNTSKSFVPANLPFRESCGGEYYRGADCSPLRISRKFTGLLIDTSKPEVISNLIDLANSFARYGCRLARGLVIHRFLLLPRRLRPIFGCGLHSGNPTNHHLESVYHKNWQTTLLWCMGTREVSLKRDRDEVTRLFEWLRLTARRTERPILPGPDDVATVCLDRTARFITTRAAHPPLVTGAGEERAWSMSPLVLGD